MSDENDIIVILSTFLMYYSEKNLLLLTLQSDNTNFLTDDEINIIRQEINDNNDDFIFFPDEMFIAYGVRYKKLLDFKKHIDEDFKNRKKKNENLYWENYIKDFDSQIEVINKLFTDTGNLKYLTFQSDLCFNIQEGKLRKIFFILDSNTLSDEYMVRDYIKSLHTFFNSKLKETVSNMKGVEVLNPEPEKTLEEKDSNKLGISVFLGDTDRFNLFKYLCDNFEVNRPSFTDLTKYNQIYTFLNYSKKIAKEPYKKLVLELYGFDYKKREVKGDTANHPF